MVVKEITLEVRCIRELIQCRHLFFLLSTADQIHVQPHTELILIDEKVDSTNRVRLIETKINC